MFLSLSWYHLCWHIIETYLCGNTAGAPQGDTASLHKDLAVCSIHLHFGKEMPEFLIQWTIYARWSNTEVCMLPTCTPMRSTMCKKKKRNDTKSLLTSWWASYCRKAPLRLTTLARSSNTRWQALQTMTGLQKNQPTLCEAKHPLSEFLSSYVSHNFLLRSLRGPDGYIGHWGLQEAQKDSFTMCNYGTDKLNAQQSKAFPHLWLPDFDKEQVAFLGQFAVFKTEMPVLMKTVGWVGLSLMKAVQWRYTAKHASKWSDCATSYVCLERFAKHSMPYHLFCVWSRANWCRRVWSFLSSSHIVCYNATYHSLQLAMTTTQRTTKKFDLPKKWCDVKESFGQPPTSFQPFLRRQLRFRNSPLVNGADPTGSFPTSYSHPEDHPSCHDG